jgi:hypothetical protein
VAIKISHQGSIWRVAKENVPDTFHSEGMVDQGDITDPETSAVGRMAELIPSDPVIMLRRIRKAPKEISESRLQSLDDKFGDLHGS